MSRRARRVLACLWFPLATTAFVGCDSMHHGFNDRFRARHASEELDSSETEDVAADVHAVGSRNPGKFFKPSRLSSGLSDEAREIERDLGIP